MTVLNRQIAHVCSAFLFTFLTLSLLTAQSDSKYEFNPDYKEGEKWVVDYQSNFSTRFQVEAQGKIVEKRRLELIDNRKYAKTFKNVQDNTPTVIEHFYVRANRQEQPANNQVTMEEQGAQVTFKWNSEKNAYDIQSSHDLSEETKSRLMAREIYRLFLPDKPVHMGSAPWAPEVDNPVSMMVALKGNEEENVLLPEFNNFTCELDNIREENGRKIAKILIRLSTSETDSASANQVDARLEGHLNYDLDNQKPVDFRISSRPAGISFKQKIEDATVNVENMGISISVKYNTSSSGEDLNSENTSSDNDE